MISAVFSCMDRESNLIESIDSWMNIPSITEIIVVDWSSKKPLRDNNHIQQWLDKNTIKLYRVNKEKVFSLSKSYNLAFSKVTQNIVLKLDCDYKNINSSWINLLSIDSKTNELKNYFLVGNYLFSKGLTGFLLVNKKDFQFYNENFTGWGYDDLDLYDRIHKSNKHLQSIIFFDILNYVYHLSHTNEERVMNYEHKNMQQSHENNYNIRNLPFTVSKYFTTYESCNYSELERII